MQSLASFDGMDPSGSEMKRIGHYTWKLGFRQLVPLALCLLVLSVSGCSQPVILKGTDLEREAAPSFRLTDQNSKTVSLTDLRGRVVVLTFLYTNCPDVCPLTAEHLKVANQQLGKAMSQVAFVAISLDPEHDTPEAIKAFNQSHGLGDTLIFLNGPQTQMWPIWAAYYVSAQPDPLHLSTVSHVSRVIVIDKTGKQRVNLDSDFDPADLVFDVRALLDEQNLVTRGSQIGPLTHQVSTLLNYSS
jgi:protein SCO1